MAAQKKEFQAFVTKWVAGGTVVKELFNSYGDTAIFLVRHTVTGGVNGNVDRYTFIRAFTVGANIQVSVDHDNITAEEMLIELFNLPHD